jgi:hypothetical protein
MRNYVEIIEQSNEVKKPSMYEYVLNRDSSINLLNTDSVTSVSILVMADFLFALESFMSH